MIVFKTITARNFLSIGNQTQAVHLDQGQLTLVLGENLDLGGDDQGARNGVGKTAMLNALSYALYGQALTNIKRDNLINKINNKGMLVTVDFEINGVKYHIERGRKPNVLKFVINDYEQKAEDLDESQGDSRQTQKTIVDLIDMSHDMFKHLLALNTYTEPFLSMKANPQRSIIEQLLGITQLSEKAETLKDQIKTTKEKINTENTRIETIKLSNEKIEQSIKMIERKKNMWVKTQTEYINDLEKSIKILKEINIDNEIIQQRALIKWTEEKNELDNINTMIANHTASLEREQKVLKKLQKELTLLADHKCHSCGQDIHDKKHEEMLEYKSNQIVDSELAITTIINDIAALTEAAALLDVDEKFPEVYYDNLENALNHKNSLTQSLKELKNKKKEINPYEEQINELKDSAFQEINWDAVNDLTTLKDHQEFLHKLLTNKDSFIRKRIIDQNLMFLNQRLSYYLNKIGLPHIVEFQNDLTVNITQLGQDLDFDNLSRGERNRLILSLSWAFRDVWENLYTPINLMFIDELIDSGLDSSGVESSIAILKKMSRESNKNIFLISHRDDLTSRVNQVLRVIKENGFTNYSTDLEIV